MIVESLEVFLELEGGIELSQKGVAGSAELLGDSCTLFTRNRTWERGIRGGPTAISPALVPGRILLVEPSSDVCEAPSNCSVSWSKDSPTEGDLGPIWTSVNGGGLGRRGEVACETPAVAIARGFAESQMSENRKKEGNEEEECKGETKGNWRRTTTS